MADPNVIYRFSELYQAGYIPSVGAWVQVDPANNLTTVVNAFNTLAPQSLEIFLFDQAGNLVGDILQRTLQTNEAMRYDLEELIPPENLPFEGSLYCWGNGPDGEHLGLQAIDLDFIDRTRPAGHILGTVHIIFDFINTLGIPPYMDLVCPRLMVDETPEGAPRYRNFLGMAHVIISTSDLTGPRIEMSVTNEDGELWIADTPIEIPQLGSWFGDLEVVFPGLPDFLRRSGEKRGYGTLNLREKNSRATGLCGMVKVVDLVSGELLVGHVNDRNFARPAMKD